MNEAAPSVDLANRPNRTAPNSRASADAAATAAGAGSLRDAVAGVLPSLRAHAIKLCLDSVEAQDLVQDTIERALRFEQTYQPGTNLRAWLHQILFSLFVTRCRRLRRERRALERLSSDPCSWTRPEPPPAMQTLPLSMEGAIEALPQHFAAVIRLVDLQEHSYRDAAKHLQVPVGTVMSRLFRGRRLLAGNLEQRGPPTACAA
jgi:RNA polymerase sigma-70 factor (ECF subfamily)